MRGLVLEAWGLGSDKTGRRDSDREKGSGKQVLAIEVVVHHWYLVRQGMRVVVSRR